MAARKPTVNDDAFDVSRRAEFGSLGQWKLSRSNDYYFHFWIDDFLEVAEDQRLRDQFPTELMLRRLGDRLSVNLNFHDSSTEVSEFLKFSPAWRDYYSVFTSQAWLIETIKTLRSEFAARYPRVIRPLFYRRVLNPKNLQVTVALSFSRRGFLLSAHSDDKFKVLTLIHYLPERGGAEGRGGTRFFLPRHKHSLAHLRQFTEWSRGFRRFLPLFRLAPSTEASLSRRYEEGVIPNESERVRFESAFALSDYVDYRVNRICGFVKNNWTLHEVNLEEFPADQFRRAALINVRLRPTVWSRLIPKTERLLSQCKQGILQR